MTRTCDMCGDPIDADHAWMQADDGAAAHSGCVYSNTDVEQRDRWMPSDTEAEA